MMTADRCHEILKAAASGAGGYVTWSEWTQLVDAGLMSYGPDGLILTDLGRKALGQS